MILSFLSLTIGTFIFRIGDLTQELMAVVNLIDSQCHRSILISLLQPPLAHSRLPSSTALSQILTG